MLTGSYSICGQSERTNEKDVSESVVKKEQKYSCSGSSQRTVVLHMGNDDRSYLLRYRTDSYLQKQIGSITQQLRYTETNKTLRTSGRSAWAFKVKMFSYLRVNYAGTLSQVIRASRQQNFTAEPLTWPRETNKRISEWPTTDELILSEAFSTCP